MNEIRSDQPFKFEREQQVVLGPSDVLDPKPDLHVAWSSRCLRLLSSAKSRGDTEPSRPTGSIAALPGGRGNVFPTVAWQQLQLSTGCSTGQLACLL